jgi:hypothetical protein
VPNKWEIRAAIGAALLVVAVPLFLSTATDYGLTAPRSLLLASLIAEGVLTAFSIALIALPSRVWRLGKLHSDVQYGLSLTGLTGMHGIDPAQPNEAFVTFVFTVRNGGGSAIKYHIESVDTQIEGQSELLAFPLQDGVVVPGNSFSITCTDTGLNAALDHLTGTLTWAAIYGPASGKYEVRWTRAMTVRFDRGGAGGTMSSHFANIAPDEYALIKPTNTPSSA